MRLNFISFPLVCTLFLFGCGGGDSDTSPSDNISQQETKKHTVSASTSSGGSISPSTITVDENQSTSFVLSTENGYKLDSVTGCDGSLTDSIYTTAAITEDCQINATFSLIVPSEYFVDSKKVLLSDNSEYTFFSLLPDSALQDQMQFNAITHLQYLLAESGIEFSQTEAKIRQYFNLFTSPYVALIPPTELHEINDVILNLANANLDTLDNVLTEIYEEIITNEWLYFRQRATLQYKFEIINNEVAIAQGENAEVSIHLPFSSPLNENYTIVWGQGGWETVESSNEKMVVNIYGGINQPVNANIKNNALNANVYTIFGELQSYSVEVVLPELIEGEQKYAVSHGLEINQADYEQSKDSWQPTVIFQNASDKLVTLDLDGLNNSSTFTYRYDPKLTPNPKELKFILVVDGDEQLITPSLIDLDNLTVSFVIPVVAESEKTASLSKIMAKNRNTSVSSRLLHVEVVRGTPDGHDIANLLDGKQEYLEKAITMLFTADNQTLTTQSAINRFVAPLYSDNDTERRLARAKLTKLLSTKTDGSYKVYQEFAAALNIAVAGQVLSDINWDAGSANKLHYWFVDCVSQYRIDTSAQCRYKLKQAYKYAPKLMNEGVSAFVGASSLSSTQQAYLAIFNTVVNVAGSRATGKIEFDAKFLTSQGVAALAPETVQYIYTLGASAYQFFQGAKSVGTIGVSLAVGWAGGELVSFVESGTKAKNVWSYTPLVYAMKANRDNIFNQVLNEPSANTVGTSLFWSREEFSQDFLSAEPYSRLSMELISPEKTFFGWESQFGDTLDPGRRFESMFLGGGHPVPEGWYFEDSISDKNRYLALKFMNAAFGDETARTEIKNFGDVSLLFSVAPTLVQVQTVPVLDVAKVELIKMGKAISFRLAVKSGYIDDNVYLCDMYSYGSGRYKYGKKCLNANRGSDVQKSTKKARLANKISTARYVSDFKNVDSGNILFDQLGLNMSKELFDKLKEIELKFVDLELSIRGHHLLIGNNVAEITTQRDKLQLNSSQFTFDDFTFNEQKQEYSLSFNSLFPELANTDFDNSVLAIGLKLVVNLSGKNHSISVLKAYTTVTDQSAVIDDTLETADVSGTLKSNGSPLADKSIRLEPTGTLQFTDSNGKFTFSSVPEGSHQLVVVTELESANITLDDISNNKIKVTFDIVTSNNGDVVTGKLEGNDGPLTLKPVKLAPIGEIEFTDSHGNFTFSSVPEGSYQLHVMNYESQSSFITLDDINNNNVEVTIEIEDFESPVSPEVQALIDLQLDKGPLALFSNDCISLKTLAAISYCTSHKEILYSIYSRYRYPQDSFSPETIKLREIQSNKGYASIMNINCQNLLETDAINYCNTEQEWIIERRERDYWVNRK